MGIYIGLYGDIYRRVWVYIGVYGIYIGGYGDIYRRVWGYI